MIKKVITNYRYWLLFIIASVAIIGTFAVPQDDLPLLTWAWVLFSTKAIGFAAFHIFAVLYKHWEKRGTIPELSQFTKDF